MFVSRFPTARCESRDPLFVDEDESVQKGTLFQQWSELVKENNEGQAKRARFSLTAAVLVVEGH